MKGLPQIVLGILAIGFISFAVKQTFSDDGHTSPSVPKPLVFENATPYAGQVGSYKWHVLKDWYKFPLRSDGTDLTHLRPMIWGVLSDGSLSTEEWVKAIDAKRKAESKL